MKTISLKLPKDLDQQLSQLAEQRHMTRSAVLREALASFVKGSDTSVRAKAGRLVGSLRGPRDLSTAKRHLDGYGQ